MNFNTSVFVGRWRTMWGKGTLVSQICFVTERKQVFKYLFLEIWTSLVAQTVKRLSMMQETQV